MMKSKMMRALAVCCASALALVLAVGCSSGKGSGSADGAAAPVDQATSGQTVTFPVAYFVDVSTPDDKMAKLEAAGCTDIVDNGDGTYTATLSADAYNQLVSDLYAQVMAAVDSVQDSATYPNVDSVSYDEGFTSMQVKLSSETPGIEDTFALAVVGVPAAVYQQVAGLPVGCQVDLVLPDGTVQQSSVYLM